jgi:tetratricopeptide (TPR) repeat protein
MIKNITRLFIVLLVVMNLNTVVYANGNAESELNSVKRDIEQLHKKSDELTNKIGQLSKDETIKSLQDGQDKLIATADHAINRINMWIAIFSVAVSIAIASGTIVTYFVQTKKFEALEKDIDKYKEDADKYKEKLIEAGKLLEGSTKEVKKAKEELDGLKKEIYTIKQDLEQAQAKSEAAADIANSTEDKLREQQQDIEKRFSEMIVELKGVREEVEGLVDKAKISEDNAKKSEYVSKASQYFNEANNEKNFNRRIELYTKAIEHNNNFAVAYNNRGNTYYERAQSMDTSNSSAIIETFNKAIEDYSEAINIYENLGDFDGLGMPYHNRATTYHALGDKINPRFYENAISDYEYIVMQNDINNQDKANAYNGCGVAYRSLGKKDKAKEFAEKAISIDAGNGYAYTTLAELYAEEGNDEEFYKNIELGLFNNCPVWEFSPNDKAYTKYLNEPRFTQLINKYKK